MQSTADGVNHNTGLSSGGQVRCAISMGMMKWRRRYMLATAVTVLAGIVLFVWMSGRAPQTPYIHATTTHVAFQWVENGKISVIVADVATGQKSAYTSRERDVSSPKFSADGRSLYILLGPKRADVRLDNIANLLYTLKRCDLDSTVCVDVATSNGALAEPVEMDDGSILVVQSFPEPRADPFAPDKPFVGFRTFDLSRIEFQGEISRVTNDAAHHLQSLSITDDQAYFSLGRVHAPGQRRVKSDIFSARVQDNGREFVIGEEPVVSHGEKSTRPTVSKDGRFLAFSSATRVPGQSGWRYDIVVYERDPLKHVRTFAPGENETFSNTVFVDGRNLIFVASKGPTFTIMRADASDGAFVSLRSFDARDLGATRVEAIDVMPGE